ncbi:hypothetical protein GCM10010466_24510 [Planomonospora alba]|uniref:Uncharacterized protein n=1 Tax=Planomonospora alba TaxID=161354 RepID=A0ABP6N1S2_9ACTN
MDRRPMSTRFDGEHVIWSDGTPERVDTVIFATGYRPDHSITAELRLDPDPVLGTTRPLAPLIDSNDHSCGTVRPRGVDEPAHPGPGYHAIGMKSYGRSPTFLLATGHPRQAHGRHRPPPRPASRPRRRGAGGGRAGRRPGSGRQAGSPRRSVRAR